MVVSMLLVIVLVQQYHENQEHIWQKNCRRTVNSVISSHEITENVTFENELDLKPTVGLFSEWIKVKQKVYSLIIYSPFCDITIFQRSDEEEEFYICKCSQESLNYSR